MRRLFQITLHGELTQPRLEHLRKLLDLQPRGRLTDTEDALFGNRSLRDVPGEWVWLDLWRGYPHWRVDLDYAGPRPDQQVIDRCEGEVLGAAAALGLLPSPARVRPVPAVRLDRRALSAGLGTRLTADQVSSWGRSLSFDEVRSLCRWMELRLESGGLSGTEFGWRYLRWDPERGSLLWQLVVGRDQAELVLLYDAEPPARQILAECRLRAERAAARAGIPVTRVWPDVGAP